jgi:hypothetical protein
VVSDRAGLTDAVFRGSGDGQRVPRVGTLVATRSATLPGAQRSPVHQLNMTPVRSPPAPSDLPAALTTAVAAVLHRAASCIGVDVIKCTVGTTGPEQPAPSSSRQRGH